MSAAAKRRQEITDALRRRIVGALRGGVLERGDRLPSVREVGAEFGVDPRLALAAYRALARDGVVEIRARSGIYAALRAASLDGGAPAIAEGWAADVLAEGIARGIAAPALGDWLTRTLAARRRRAVVVATSDDQVDGMCRELRGDYGLEARGILAAELDARAPAALRRADLVVTTDAHATRVRALAGARGLPCVVVTVRPDLVGAEWRLLLRDPVYVVVSDARFVSVLRDYLRATPGARNVRPVVLGRDDPKLIPADAPVYVTRSARARLGRATVPGRLVPPARIFSPDCAREILRLVLRLNLEELERREAGAR